ncbi:hypothetical protein KIW84_011880 [Lathyrus oleraceus]|uniref:Uncharacterized protein n=1 Tax=Pisum sativum TaxID=3888 RepID=A0A9D5BG48_PEA|nr:hypothetical protein KIW84_011880 [Pisum sativum]
MVSNCEHDHDGYGICSVNPRGCEIVKRDIQRLMDEGMIQIVQSRHVDDDVNVIIPVFKNPEKMVIRSGRVFGPVFPKDVEDSTVSKKVEVSAADPVSASKHQSGESINLKTNDDDEVLRLIKKSDFSVVEQMLQTP